MSFRSLSRRHGFVSKIIFLAVCGVLFLFSSIEARQASAKKAAVAFPVIPVIARYEYAPHYFMQWITTHAQYSMIEATIGDEREAAANVLITLTEKETRKRIFYSSSEKRVAALRAAGNEAYLVKIDYKQTPGAAEQQPIYGFGFQDKNGQPILWRVTSASEPSEKGAGLSPSPAGFPGLLLQYRDLGTTIGEGTAIQIGTKVIEADPWTEISKAPYFVAYRGAVSTGNYMGALLAKTEQWSVVASPGELKTGAEWTLKNAAGQSRTLRITAQKNDEFTIDEINQIESVPLRLIVRNTPAGFALRSLEWGNSGQKMRIAFAPELPPFDTSVSGAKDVSFIIGEGKKENIASGTISIERDADKFHFRWSPNSPDWAKTKAIDTLITLGADAYSIETTTAKK